MYRVYSLPRQCSEHQILVNDEIDRWEEYEGLKLALVDDPVPLELAEELGGIPTLESYWHERPNTRSSHYSGHCGERRGAPYCGRKRQKKS